MSWPSAPRLRLFALAAAALAASPACRRTSGPPPERFLSARTGWTFVIPDLRRAAKELGALHATAATFPGAGTIRQSRAVLKTQLGFDLLDADALAAAGVEPSRGLALGVEPGRSPVDLQGKLGAPTLILPVRDAAALERTVARLARDRLDAPEQTSSSEGAIRTVTFRAEGAEHAALALGIRSEDRTAALSAGPEAEEAVRAALSRPIAESLGEDPSWRRLRSALGGRHAAIFARFDRASRAGWTFHTPYGPGADRELALGLSASPDLLHVGLAVPFGEDAGAVRSLKAEGSSRAALRALPPDAPLALRWDADPAALGELLAPLVPEGDRRWLGAHGLDLQRDIFDVLAPGAAAAISLSPRLELRDLSPAALRADPLRVIRFELVAEVKDEARAAETLAKLPALLAAMQGTGAKPAPADASRRTGTIATPAGELAWRLDGKRLRVIGGEAGAHDRLAARPTTAWAAPTKASAAALEGGLGGAVLAPRALAASVRRLPDAAYGDDPTGFLMRSVVESSLAPLDRLQAVSARAEVHQAALVIFVEVEAAPPTRERERERR